MSFGATPRAGLVFDLGSRRVLWRRGATRVLPIASLTKVMTALVAVERLAPGERVRIPVAAPAVRGSKMGALVPGRRVRAEALLQGLLIPSGNDAAIALAVGAAGSERRFVTLMNRRARRLGLTCTRYVTVHGLGAGNRSCPADLAELATRAITQPRIARIAARASAAVDVGGERVQALRTTNPLLRAGYPGAIGLKTGFTPAAGRCLIAIVRRDGRRIGVVLLGSLDPGATARRLLEAARRARVIRSSPGSP
ncbi:MAG: D-alanyl-D-alanine carboxypeptidase [Solirubrobacterales bacterium]|nr:D-alanyl-D-alanine carboxypeptidase [Solirubrobacterales bacterium]